MVSLGKIMKIEFKGDGVWKDIGYWDGSHFEPIVEEPPQVLMKFDEVFIDAAGVLDALIQDVEIRGKSMGCPTHVCLLGQMFKIHAISNMGYTSSLDLPNPKLWAEMDGLPMPIEKSTPHLCLDIAGEDAIRFRQAVEMHQALQSHLAIKAQATTWEVQFGVETSGAPSVWKMLYGSDSPPTIDQRGRSHQSRAQDLMGKIPALKERVHCPCTCPISQGRYKVEDCIMHLNDVHHPNTPLAPDGWEPWTREQIADWVDSLPFDFTVQPQPNGGRGSRAEFEALPEYMKVQETIDEALLQKMVDGMNIPISFIINKEEDK